MGYRIKALPNKKSHPKYKIQYRSYAGGERKDTDVKRKKWYEHGFNEDMTFEEAQERARQLNAQAKLKREQEARVKIDKRFEKEDNVKCAFLPPILVEEFESKVLFRGVYGDPERIKRSKTMSHWRAAKRVIRAVQLDPSNYEDEYMAFYDYFEQHEWSISYVEKVLKLLNRWGFYCSKKQNKAFLPMPAPRGRDRQRIADAYYDSDKTKKESAPLTPNQLEKAKGLFMEENYNWLLVTIWFGLRPIEVDNLKTPQGKLWDLVEESGYIVLKVYQSKLSNLDRDKRWKYIPCIFPEQEKLIELIQEGNFKRPLSKTIKKHINEDTTCYGGRKGFTNLMLDRGVPLEAVSSYLGHQSIDRTWITYRDKNKVLLPLDQNKVIRLRKTGT